MLFDRCQFADLVIKVGVGTFCGIALFVAAEGDPIILQVKQARPSVLEPYLGKRANTRTTASASSPASA